MKRLLLSSLLLSLVLLFATAWSAVAQNAAYREGELLVKYRDNSVRSMAAMNAAYNQVRAVNVKRFHGVLKNFEHLTIDLSRQTVEEAAEALTRDPSVEYAEPNYLIYAQDFEAEGKFTIPGKGERPGIRERPNYGAESPDTMLNLTWGMKKIGASQAWNKSRGSTDVLVAVVDTGVDYNHPDLAPNIWRNPNFNRTQATGIDAEAKNEISGDLVGWDFVHNDNLPFDDAGHGTHVAGIIGAVGGNGRGVSGVSQRVSIMAVKFLGSNGVGDTAAAIRGIDYAISRGAKIINNSWGGRGGINKALRDAIHRSADAGALFVSSAGNDGTNNDSFYSFPASFRISNMITVASTNSKDGLSSFSNYGAASVHIAAPGQSILSTLPGGRYGYMTGTSMAAPHVSGAAALLWALHPNWRASQIKQRLINSGDYLANLKGKLLYQRRLNVLRAIQ